MNKKLLLIIVATIIIIIVIGYSGIKSLQTDEDNQKIIQLIEEQNFIFDIINMDKLDYVDKNGLITVLNPEFKLKPELHALYEEVGMYDNPHDSLVIFPVFTESAYSDNGFYSYYKGECGIECLTVTLSDELSYESSGAGLQILSLLGYHIISDVEIVKNPEIIKQYNKVILLHNEYVTQEEFDAITNHPKVIYLYPNALYGKIKFNEKENTITLIRGHGYPESSIDNGFDWKFDNTRPYEFDNTCLNMKFFEIDNGYMLNCYPEQAIATSKNLLKTIKEF